VAAVLRYGARTVGLTVTSGAESPDRALTAAAGDDSGTGGYGLAGMRERLLLIGGDLTAGPVDDAGVCTRRWRGERAGRGGR
jgi:hypothetical protein